jgi:hypothetical protein
MKSIKFLFAGLALVSGLAMSSCNKQNETTPVHSQKSTASTTDDIGALHNKGLDYFLEHADFEKAMEEVYPMTLEFCKGEGYDEDKIRETLDDPFVKGIIDGEKEGALEAYFREKEMKTEADFLTSMETAIKTATSGEEAVKSLELVGKKIDASEDLADESKAALLAGISVGKSSARYWFREAELGSESTWVTKTRAAIGIDAEGTTGGPDWGAVIMADIRGALTGSITGGWLGALGSGLMASGKSILDQLIKIK